MKHSCSWPGCNKAVDVERWGCGTHWHLLPEKIRTAIWRSFTPGQRAETWSREYQRAFFDAQSWIVATFGAEGGQEKWDPGKWDRLVRLIQQRDAARAARRAKAKGTTDGPQ